MSMAMAMGIQAKRINHTDINTNSISRSSLSIDNAIPPPVTFPRLIVLCKDLFEKWAKLDDSRFSVKTVSGGITNILLKVSVKEENGDNVAVTVRLYGPNTEHVINRECELQDFGAKLLGVFGNGMIQSFIDARTLTPLDIRKPKLIAERKATS